MNRLQVNEHKKVLYLVDSDYSWDDCMEAELNINKKNSIILKKYEKHLQAFGDVMRDIIIAVYQENIEEIIVVGTGDVQINTEDLRLKIFENKKLSKKIQTIDYLFKNSMPEFSGGSVIQWLEGSQTNNVQHSVDIIRQHPLMPSHIKVRELLIKEGHVDKEISAL